MFSVNFTDFRKTIDNFENYHFEKYGSIKWLYETFGPVFLPGKVLEGKKIIVSNTLLILHFTQNLKCKNATTVAMTFNKYGKVILHII